MVQQQDRQALQDAVSPERFAQAKTYQQYAASISQNQAKFADNLAKTNVTDDLARRLKALAAKPNGPARMLVLGEDWCPDVYRGMPVAKRIADAAGIEMRVLERDQNLDVAEQFKKDGEFLSIPVLIFYTKDHRYIAHWIERPRKANDEMREATSPVFGPSGERALTEKLGRAPTADEKAEARADAMRRYDEFQASSPYWANWRNYTLEEVTELLEQAV
ncbi:MAG: thioredoxin family protein [Dehalococcoidia bacterium]